MHVFRVGILSQVILATSRFGGPRVDGLQLPLPSSFGQAAMPPKKPKTLVVPPVERGVDGDFPPYEPDSKRGYLVAINWTIKFYRSLESGSAVEAAWAETNHLYAGESVPHEILLPQFIHDTDNRRFGHFDPYVRPVLVRWETMWNYLSTAAVGLPDHVLTDPPTGMLVTHNGIADPLLQGSFTYCCVFAWSPCPESPTAYFLGCRADSTGTKPAFIAHFDRQITTPAQGIGIRARLRSVWTHGARSRAPNTWHPAQAQNNVLPWGNLRYAEPVHSQVEAESDEAREIRGDAMRDAAGVPFVVVERPLLRPLLQLNSDNRLVYPEPLGHETYGDADDRIALELANIGFAGTAVPPGLAPPNEPLPKKAPPHMPNAALPKKAPPPKAPHLDISSNDGLDTSSNDDFPPRTEDGPQRVYIGTPKAPPPVHAEPGARGLEVTAVRPPARVLEYKAVPPIRQPLVEERAVVRAARYDTLDRPLADGLNLEAPALAGTPKQRTLSENSGVAVPKPKFASIQSGLLPRTAPPVRPPPRNPALAPSTNPSDPVIQNNGQPESEPDSSLLGRCVPAVLAEEGYVQETFPLPVDPPRPSELLSDDRQLDTRRRYAFNVVMQHPPPQVVDSGSMVGSIEGAHLLPPPVAVRRRPAAPPKAAKAPPVPPKAHTLGQESGLATGVSLFPDYTAPTNWSTDDWQWSNDDWSGRAWDGWTG